MVAIVEPMQLPPHLVIGREYRRRTDLHPYYRGNQQSGISPSRVGRAVLLFSNDAGKSHGYVDGWQPDGSYLYSASGQGRDMSFRADNRAVRDHSIEGNALLLFRGTRKGHYAFVGEMVCAGYEQVMDSLGPGGADRNTIVFRLVPLGSLDESEQVESDDPLAVGSGFDLKSRSLVELRHLAEQSTGEPTSAIEALRTVYRRSAAVRMYVLLRADGRCEGCGIAAPFQKVDGTPYLEPHHMTRLSDGGPDHPDHVIALCPTCHRRVHFGEDGAKYNESLRRSANV